MRLMVDTWQVQLTWCRRLPSQRFRAGTARSRRGRWETSGEPVEVGLFAMDKTDGEVIRVTVSWRTAQGVAGSARPRPGSRSHPVEQQRQVPGSPTGPSHRSRPTPSPRLPDLQALTAEAADRAQRTVRAAARVRYPITQRKESRSSSPTNSTASKAGNDKKANAQERPRGILRVQEDEYYHLTMLIRDCLREADVTVSKVQTKASERFTDFRGENKTEPLGLLRARRRALGGSRLPDHRHPAPG